jgi:di/tricarboxylate transporter
LQNIGGLVDTVEDQTFTTVVGLMLLDMLLLPALPPNQAGQNGATRAILDTVFGRFRR